MKSALPLQLKTLGLAAPMPQHLVRLAAHAKDPLPSDNASSRGPFAAPDATAAPEPGDDVERSWLRRLADVLDAPGEIDADACQLTGYLWLGGRRAAEDVFYGNARRVTHMLNVAEPWCAMGPNSDGVRYCGVEARDERSFDVLGEASYGKIRAYAAAERERAPGAVFLLCCDRGVNRSAACAAAWLMDAERRAPAPGGGARRGAARGRGAARPRLPPQDDAHRGRPPHQGAARRRARQRRVPRAPRGLRAAPGPARRRGR